MRTTLNINPELLAEAVKITGERDRGRAVNKAMEEYIRREKITRLIAARGSFGIEDKTVEWEESDMELEKEWAKYCGNDEAL